MNGKVQLVDHEVQRFAAESCLHFLTILFEKAEAVRQSDDPAALHDMRVASRRLRECFRLFASFFTPKKLRRASKALKEMTCILGMPREMDVNVNLLRAYKPKRAEWMKACHEYLLEIFEFDQARRRKKMRKALDALDLKSLEPALRSFIKSAWDGNTTPAMLLDARRNADLKQFLDKAAVVLQKKAAPIKTFNEEDNALRSDDTRLHRLRIDVKRCRYCLEILNPVYHQKWDGEIQLAKQLQNILGNIHDYGVLLAHLKAQQARLQEKHRTRLARGCQRVIAELEELKLSFYAKVGPAYLAFIQELQQCLPSVSVAPAMPRAEAKTTPCVVDPSPVDIAQNTDPPQQPS